MSVMSKNEITCTPMKYIINGRGGLTSFEVLRRSIEQKGREGTIVVFANVKGSGRSHWWGFPTLTAHDALHNSRHKHRSRKTNHLPVNGAGPQA